MIKLKQRSPNFRIDLSKIDLTSILTNSQLAIQDSLKPVKTNPTILKNKSRATSVKATPHISYPSIRLRSPSRPPNSNIPIIPLNFRFAKLDELRKKIESKQVLSKISPKPLKKTNEKLIENPSYSAISGKNTERTAVFERLNSGQPFKSIMYLKGNPKFSNRIILA